MTYIEISTLNVLIGLAVNGIFTGLGAAIGTWVAQKGVIDRFSKIKNKIKK